METLVTGIHSCSRKATGLTDHHKLGQSTTLRKVHLCGNYALDFHTHTLPPGCPFSSRTRYVNADPHSDSVFDAEMKWLPILLYFLPHVRQTVVGSFGLGRALFAAGRSFVLTSSRGRYSAGTIRKSARHHMWPLTFFNGELATWNDVNTRHGAQYPYDSPRRVRC